MTTPNQPGWYDDPQDSNAQRYWDGQSWTLHRQRKPAARPAPPPPQGPQAPPPAQAPNAPPRKRSRAPLVVAALIAVAVLAVGGVLGYKRVIAPKLAENQIKTLVQNVTNAQNNADGQGLLQLDCERARGQNPVTSQMLRNDIDEEGTVATTVTNVHVTGDRATATVTTTRSKSPDDHMPETWSFVKEKGSWKWCGRADNSG
ncbi:DUF2510 domain-containing protein [Mycobacterium alsense]|uniref:DUF2510 domain-containing protein n=1 Tax=Mycobacterium alsense TaxID=324058 RepID=UPI0009EF093F|nr:DUF2510 domain-containing protein [Mycobacterium alsense]